MKFDKMNFDKMNSNKKIWILFLCIVFLAGIFAIFSVDSSVYNSDHNNKKTTIETMVPTQNASSCPDMLIKNGNLLLLYDSKKPVGNGTNPIPFANLDEYIHYLEGQRSQGIDCPVLFLQKENNAQGDNVYRIRPSPFDLEGGLPPMIPPIFSNEANSQAINQYLSGAGLSGSVPSSPDHPNVVNIMDASRENTKYNSNQYAGFDPQGLYVGIYTNIDQIHDSTNHSHLSDNPMDPNWAGIQYTNQSILSGKYAENNVSKPLLFQPRGRFDPQLPANFPPPNDII